MAASTPRLLPCACRLLAALSFFALTHPVLAGSDWPEQPRRYVHIELPDNLDFLFGIRLQNSQDSDLFRQALEMITKNRDQFNLDPAMIKKMNLDEAHVRSIFNKWKALGKGSLEAASIQRLKEQLVLELSARDQSQKDARPFMPPIRMMPPPSPLNMGASAPPPKSQDDVMADWMRDIVRGAEGSNLGDALKQSRAWQDGMAQLGALGSPEDSASPLEGLVKKWGLANHVHLPEMRQLWQQLGKLPLPEMSSRRWGLPSIKLDAPAISLDLPHFGGPAGFQGGETLLWLVLVLGLLICAWHFFTLQRRSQATLRAAVLGPWPVDPGQVATRGQLIKAFEYLALTRLGLAVKTWNHRAIAARLATESASQRLAADQLGQLYEQARYTRGQDPLDQADQALARRAFGVLVNA